MTPEPPIDLQSPARKQSFARDPIANDRQPPYSAEAEKAVLGSILLEPVYAMGICVERLAANGDEFYDPRNAQIYRICLELNASNTPPDLILIVERLKERSLLDDVGGWPYLNDLDEGVLPAHLEHYVGIILDKYLIRKLIQTCTNALSAAYEARDGKALIDEVEGDILRIRSTRDSRGERTIKELVKAALSDIEADFERKGQVSGIPTGFKDLDRLTSGLQPSEMIVIAARPSIGKSSLCANIVEHVSVDCGIPCGVISLEMSDKSIVKRLICSRARVNMRNVRDGFLTESDFPKIALAAGKISGAPIQIWDVSGATITAIRAKARRWHREHKIKLLVIDYIQLAHGSKQRYDNREREVAEISEGCKGIAKELEIPVIAVCQLNREVDKRKSGRPVMSDLRESGSIEQDADIIGFLYRSEDGEGKESSDGVIPVNLYIAKARNSEAGEDLPLTFFKRLTRFETASRIADEDLPVNNGRRPYND